MENTATTDQPELTPVREQHKFDEGRLAAYLTEHVGDDFRRLDILQFEGGQSNPTFHVTAGGKAYVLRKKPPGQLLKSAHAVDREYRVMRALEHTDVPVPKMVLLCEDDSVIGTDFFLMEHVPGRVAVDPRLPTFTPENRRKVYTHFIEVLAAIHRVDLEAVGLTDYGRAGNYYERQISRWTKQYKASETKHLEAMENLVEWLPKNIPDTDQTTLVHGDYRIGNCIIHPTEPRIVAVLDWELSTTGHPLADVGYCCMMYHSDITDGSTLDPEAENIPNEQEFLDLYCKAAGRGPIENWKFYIVYNLFRSAAIVQGVYKRGLDGIASSERWRERADYCELAAGRAWELVEQS